MTGAVILVSAALDVGGLYLFSQLFATDEGTGPIVTIVAKVALLAVDGAWLLFAPLLAIGVVQQVLPLLGEKIFFDGMRASVRGTGGSSTGEELAGNTKGIDTDPTAAVKVARIESLEASDGLGLLGLGVAASRAQKLATIGGGVIPAGVGLGFFPLAGPIVATTLTTTFSAYTLAW